MLILRGYDSDVNNILSSVARGDIESGDNTSHTFVYNPSNYPIESTTITAQGTEKEETSTSQYFYQ